MAIKIKIGNGAYQGANALKIVRSKAAAVRELRNRGVRRDDARSTVNAACGHDRRAAFSCRVATAYKDYHGFDIGEPVEVSRFEGG